MTFKELDLSGVSLSNTIEAGEYRAVVDSAEYLPTKNGNGAFIKCEFKLLDNEYKLTHRFNIVNSNEMAQNIGLKQLKTLMLASGMSDTKLKDPAALIMNTCLLVVGVEDKNDGYGPKNIIKNFKPLEKTSPILNKATQAMKGKIGF